MLACLGILLAVLVTWGANPVYSILTLITSALCLGYFLLNQGLEFISFLIVLIYIGAVAVLFLFVVMMINFKISDQKFYLFEGIIFWLFTVLNIELDSLEIVNFKSSMDCTNFESLGFYLYDVFPQSLGLVALILFVAMVGAISLTYISAENYRSQHIPTQIRQPSALYKLDKSFLIFGVFEYYLWPISIFLVFAFFYKFFKTDEKIKFIIRLFNIMIYCLGIFTFFFFIWVWYTNLFFYMYNLFEISRLCTEQYHNVHKVEQLVRVTHHPLYEGIWIFWWFQNLYNPYLILLSAIGEQPHTIMESFVRQDMVWINNSIRVSQEELRNALYHQQQFFNMYPTPGAARALNPYYAKYLEQNIERTELNIEFGYQRLKGAKDLINVHHASHDFRIFFSIVRWIYSFR